MLYIKYTNDSFWAIWHCCHFFLPSRLYFNVFEGYLVGHLTYYTGSIIDLALQALQNKHFTLCYFHSTIDIAFTADFADKTLCQTIWDDSFTVWGHLTIIIF